jgi:hypothetical protein
MNSTSGWTTVGPGRAPSRLTPDPKPEAAGGMVPAVIVLLLLIVLVATDHAGEP